MAEGQGWERVTDEDFRARVLGSDTPAVVEMAADWCGACDILEPIIQQIARSFRGRVATYRMDVDESPATAERFGIRQPPVLLFFSKGSLIEVIQGTAPRTRIVTTLEQLIASDGPPADGS